MEIEQVEVEQARIGTFACLHASLLSLLPAFLPFFVPSFRLSFLGTDVCGFCRVLALAVSSEEAEEGREGGGGRGGGGS